jgi:CMP-N,N'-diacetyllegionaminic acid synthase
MLPRGIGGHDPRIAKWLMTDSFMLTLIPARGGSKRLPGKNLRALGGKSLLAWTSGAARMAGSCGEIILSTDDPEIAAEGEALGLSVPFLRPAELATDEISTVDVALHVLDWAEKTRDFVPDYLLLLQPTSPFRSPALIREGVARLGATSAANALVSVAAVHLGSEHVYTEKAEYLSSIDPDGALGRCMVPSGALYLIRPAVLRATRTFIPPRTLALHHAGVSTLDIDTPEEWAIAEAAVATGLCVN